jgi:hypothetical protein
MIIYLVLHIIMLTITTSTNYSELEEVIVQVPTDTNTNSSSAPAPKHPNTIINRLMYLIAMVRCVPSTLNESENAV